MALQLKSESFLNNDQIPRRHTGEGEDISPELHWSGVAETAKQLVLICDDPDAPQEDPFVHWVVYNIPPDRHSLPENISDRGVTQGKNSFGDIAYGGPLPPAGHGPHHYQFRLYALSEELSLPPGLTKEEVLKSIEGKILQEAELWGTYERMARAAND